MTERAVLAGPLACPACGWILAPSYDRKTVTCENGVTPACRLYGLRFKAPVLELEPVDGESVNMGPTDA